MFHSSYLSWFEKNNTFFKYCYFFSTIIFLNLGSLVNRGQRNMHSSKTQDVSHIAFGSKILGPPPSSNRRVSTRVSGEVRRLKLQQSCWRLYKGGECHAEESHWRGFFRTGVRLCLECSGWWGPRSKRHCTIQGGQVKCLGGYSSAMGLFSRQKRRLREKLVAVFS